MSMANWCNNVNNKVCFYASPGGPIPPPPGQSRVKWQSVPPLHCGEQRAGLACNSAMSKAGLRFGQVNYHH